MGRWAGGCSVPVSLPGFHHHGPEPGWLHRQGGPEGHLCCPGWVTSSRRLGAWGQSEPWPSRKSRQLGAGQGGWRRGCEGLVFSGGAEEGRPPPGRSGEIPGVRGGLTRGGGAQQSRGRHRWWRRGAVVARAKAGRGRGRGQQSRGRRSGWGRGWRYPGVGLGLLGGLQLPARLLPSLRAQGWA